MATRNFDAAKRNKCDEFYTQFVDIENELCHYLDQFKNKIIYCNCDNPYESNFFKYFIINFNSLGLKGLIASFYSQEAYKIVINEVKDNFSSIEHLLKNKKNALTRLKGDGDFRSEECIELLKQADIVVTNPPFSLFREYVAQLMEYKKKFLIIGNKNALTYKEIFPLVKENKMYTGYRSVNSDIWFIVPDDYNYERIIDGKKLKHSMACWFTNLEVEKHKKNITLYKKYTPEEYPKYDNYDAIDVSKVAEIPYDYTGAMGVPITFIDKYNPEQFEIIALGNSRDNFTPIKNYINPIKVKKDGTEVSGGAINCVLTINQKTKPVDKVYYKSDNSDYLIPPYARIIIRRIGDTQ